MAPKIANLTPARDVLDARTIVGSKINVLGIVVDFRAPVPTRGKGKASYYSAGNFDDVVVRLDADVDSNRLQGSDPLIRRVHSR